MERATKEAWCQEIAKALPGNWTWDVPKSYDGHPMWYGTMTSAETGMVVAVNFRGDRAQFSPHIPLDHNGRMQGWKDVAPRIPPSFDHPPQPECSADMGRNPLPVARQVLRSVIDPYREHFAAIMAKMDERQTADADADAAFARMVALTGKQPSKGHPAGRHMWCPAPHIRTITVQTYGTALELNTLPYELAERIVALVIEHAKANTPNA